MSVRPGELDRLRIAVEAANLVPFIDDVEDFAWEVAWAYSQGLPTPTRQRTKDLFDVVDTTRKIGWSAKTLVWNLKAPACEFVIQRADVIKKRDELGFPDLTLDAPPQLIGDAVIEHWRRKILNDMVKQGVGDSRVALLLKSKDRRSVIPYEEQLPVPDASQVTWRWRNEGRAGLLGHTEGVLRYRWYPNQKQLFEIFPLDCARAPLSVNATAIGMSELIERLGLSAHSQA